jgi:hypothetical protein
MGRSYSMGKMKNKILVGRLDVDGKIMSEISGK